MICAACFCYRCGTPVTSSSCMARCCARALTVCSSYNLESGTVRPRQSVPKAIESTSPRHELRPHNGPCLCPAAVVTAALPSVKSCPPPVSPCAPSGQASKGCKEAAKKRRGLHGERLAAGAAQVCRDPAASKRMQCLPPSAFRLPPSAFRLPPSAFRLPPSAFRLLACNVKPLQHTAAAAHCST